MRIKDIFPLETTNLKIQQLIGPNDQTLRLLEKKYNVELNLRGDQVLINGELSEVKKVKEKLSELLTRLEVDDKLDYQTVYEIVEHGSLVDTGKP